MPTTTSGSFIAKARSKPRRSTPPWNPPAAECCAAAPPILEFDEAGDLIGHWGGPGEGYDWPASNHGIDVDYKGNVWIGGNGRGQQPTAARCPADESKMGGGARARQHGPEVHAERQVPDADRQAQPEQGQQRHRESEAAGENAGRSEDQRTVRGRRLRQPPRDRLRRRHRQVQAPLGRLRQQARRHAASALQSRAIRRRSSSAIRCTASSSPTTACCTSATAPTTASRSSRPTARS